MYHSRHTAVKSAYLLRFASGARRRTVACWAKMSAVDKPADVDKLLTLNIGGATKPAIWMQSLSQEGSGAEHSGGDCTRLSASSFKHEVSRRAVTGLEGSAASPLRRSRWLLRCRRPLESSGQWIRRTSSAMPGSTAALPAACIKELPVPTTRNFTQVGAHVETPGSPDKAVLENAPLRRGDGPPAIVRCTCPEFTSVCPSPVSRVSS